MLGDKRYNDKISDVPREAVQRDLDQSRQFLAKFEAIDTTVFPNKKC